MASTTNQPEAVKEKKRWRMSGLLGKNKQGEQQIIEEEEVANVTPPSVSRADLTTTPTVSRPDLIPSSSANNRDSAYGSASNKTDSTLGLPTISQSQAEQTDAPVKIQTDRGTGRRVVVVTTTTKTEVFDTDGDGHSVPAGKDVVVRKTESDNTPAQPQDVGATRVEETRETSRPDVPRRSSRRSMSPNRESHVPNLPVTNETTTAPDVNTARNATATPNRQLDNNSSTARSPTRRPLSPSYNANTEATAQPIYQPQAPAPAPNTNYSNGYNSQNPGNYQEHQNTLQNQNSYPSNQNGHNLQNQPSYSQNQPVQDPVERVVSPYSGSVKRRPVPGQVNGQSQRVGTLDSLKAAAAGIHGAGETLRGTLNSKLDRTTGGTAESIAAHDAVTQRGLQEIQTGQFGHGANPNHVPAGVTGTAVQPTTSGGGLDNNGSAGRSSGLRGLFSQSKR